MNLMNPKENKATNPIIPVVRQNRRNHVETVLPAEKMTLEETFSCADSLEVKKRTNRFEVDINVINTIG
jgi:hypothetical protein